MTEAEYLLLSNLLYFEEFSDGSSEGETVERIIAKGISTKGDDYTTSREYQDILDLVASNPDIMNMKIVSTYSDSTGAAAACFVTEDGQAIAVFRGTGAQEWDDNVWGANSVITPAQSNALNWINSLGYDNIIVTGHSKGGNKAMFVSVMSDMVAQCYSFDGQGFGPEFIEKYADRILAMQDNMHSISHSYDFVNILLYDITGDQKYLANFLDVNGLAEYHTPNALFKYEWVYDDKTGEWLAKPVLELAAESEQSALMQFLHGYICYLMENQEQAEIDKMVDVLAPILDKYMGKQDPDIDMIDTFVQALSMLGHFVTYLNQVKESDPELYEQMLKELHDILVELFGITYADSIIEAFEDGISVGSVASLLKDIMSSSAAVGMIRDFTADTKSFLLETVKEVEDEKWFDITRWECWYWVEDKLNNLNVSSYADDISTYYRKIIYLNDCTVQDIEKLFEAVYSVESTYAGKTQGHFAALSDEMEKMKAAVSRLAPATA